MQIGEKSDFAVLSLKNLTKFSDQFSIFPDNYFFFHESIFLNLGETFKANTKIFKTVNFLKMLSIYMFYNLSLFFPNRKLY